MIRFLSRLALHITLIGLVAACGSGSSSGGGGGGGGGGGSNPPTVTLSSIAVTPGAATVPAGLTQQFTATGTYSDNTTKDLTTSVTWSSDSGNATIVATSGLATGVAAGTANITATYTNSSGSTKGTVALTVGPPNLVSIVVSPDKPTLGINKSAPFYAIATYTDHSTKDLTSSVTWTSSDPTVVQITAAGKATAQGHPGTAQITAAMTGATIAPVTVTVTATTFVYATNFDDNSVSQYSIANDGTLTALATGTVSTDKQPFSISVEPTGEFVYVSNYSSSTVSQFRIGTDGTLSKIGTGSVATGASPNAVTIDPSNKHAYVANLGENTISQYNIELDGALSPMATPKVPAGSNVATVVVDPTGKFAYAGNWGANAPQPPAGPSTISQYTISQTDGSLTPISGAATVGTGSGPNAIVIDPSGKYLYVANFGDNNIGQYTINADGTLSPLTNVGAPAGLVSSGLQPDGIAIDPTGHYVYTANKGDGTVSQFTVGNDGGLVPMTTAHVFTNGNGPSAVMVDPTGQYVYVPNRGDTTITQFKIGAGGALVAAGQVQAGLHPTSIAAGY